ncbi:glycosyltransferase [Lutibacter flavus]|uniref:Glycosyltransferase Family 4 n=1 Tax=Lutibacter flavus TaxID=691689 RepID=A0A238YYI3_9FLAO|nr:glycosyltransferase [Lutibacter flavus]SNR76127.1 Glycosyltransferase Family 4 [Lutibacter flavus]
MYSKKVLIIINSLKKGGAERIASEFSFYLDRLGYVPIFLLTDGGYVNYKVPVASKIIKLPLSKYSRTFLFPIITLIQAIYVRLYFGGNFKAISFLHRANLVNALSSFFSNRSVVISERSIFSKSYQGYKYYLMKGLLKIIFLRANKIIAISQVVKNELIANFKLNASKITILHNPINIDEFQLKKEKNKFYSTSKNLNFCTVSRLINSKRVDLVIDLFFKLLKFFPESKLHIIGEGDNKEKLIEKIYDLNIQKNVVFYGNVSNVNSILTKCDVFIFASLYESFGNVVLEATSSGLPVVYTSNLESVSEIYLGSNSLSFSFNENFIEMDVELIFKFIDSLKYESFINERATLLKKYSSDDIFKLYFKEIKG